MEKLPNFSTECDTKKESLGEAPAILAKRKVVQVVPWCPPPPDIQLDQCCDPDNPKNITYKDVVKATRMISQDIPKTPLLKSKWCAKFDMELYYKIEIFYQTGSYNERKALYALSILNEEDRKQGVITASLGNWALVLYSVFDSTREAQMRQTFQKHIGTICYVVSSSVPQTTNNTLSNVVCVRLPDYSEALAYYGQRLNISITVVLPSNTSVNVVRKCHEFGAFVVLYGETLDDARRQAFIMLNKRGQVYINGYDHPHVIAASGSIGIEILEQLPQTDAIIVPVGGGGLLAGIAAAVKHIKPEILVYGIQTRKSSAFFKAMEDGRPNQTVVTHNLATSLAVPTAGYNAYHTAKSLVDKMILVNDNEIARAMLHLVEEEKLVVEGSAASSLAACMCIPDILPELKEKTVVCILTGGNVDSIILPRCLERAKAIDGRIIKISVRVAADNPWEHLHLMSMIANVGANVIQYYSEKALLEDDNYNTNYIKILCETRDINHACTLKRVLERLFPQKCRFFEEPYSAVPFCACFPRRINL